MKKIPGVWSPPCKVDSDCPFHAKNKNYTNNRGGCLSDGKCEMPTGMIPVGNRHFWGKPDCHGCKQDGTETTDECCSEQEDRISYPDLMSPDYAFSDDDIERRN